MKLFGFAVFAATLVAASSQAQAEEKAEAGCRPCGMVPRPGRRPCCPSSSDLPPVPPPAPCPCCPQPPSDYWCPCDCPTSSSTICPPPPVPVPPCPVVCCDSSSESCSSSTQVQCQYRRVPVPRPFVKPRCKPRSSSSSTLPCCRRRKPRCVKPPKPCGCGAKVGAQDGGDDAEVPQDGEAQVGDAQVADDAQDEDVPQDAGADAQTAQQTSWSITWPTQYADEEPNLAQQIADLEAMIEELEEELEELEEEFAIAIQNEDDPEDMFILTADDLATLEETVAEADAAVTAADADVAVTAADADAAVTAADADAVVEKHCPAPSCPKKRALQVVFQLDRKFVKLVNEQNLPDLYGMITDHSRYAMITPNADTPGCTRVVGPLAQFLPNYIGYSLTTVFQDIAYNKDGSVTIHVLDVLTQGSTTIIAEDVWRTYKAATGCQYKIDYLNGVNWLCK